MIIRRAHRSDTDQIYSLIQAFDEYYTKQSIFTKDYLPFSEYANKEDTFKRVIDLWFNNPKYYLFVAEDKGALIGYICGTIHNKVERILNREGFIEDWFVQQEHRHEGVGRQLYSALLEIFYQEKCNRLGLHAYIANTDAIRMYKKMGYIESEISMVRQFP